MYSMCGEITSEAQDPQYLDANSAPRSLDNEKLYFDYADFLILIGFRERNS